MLALMHRDSHLRVVTDRIGTTYSPVLIVTSLLLSWFIFVVKKFVLVNCALPPKRIYNSYTQNIYFLVFLLLTLFMMILPVFFAITRYIDDIFGKSLTRLSSIESNRRAVPLATNYFPLARAGT